MSDVVPILDALIRMRTPNPGGDEPALASWLAERLRAFDPDEITLREVPRPDGAGAWVLARWGTPRLLVNAHLDTVPVNAGWTGDPFVPRIDADRVTGLGAADTKGAIAAILAALAAARPRDLAVLFSGDEENRGTVMRAFLAEVHLPAVERAVVCEPTRLRAGTRHRGILALAAKLTGEGGHSSRADSLPAPLAELARLAVVWHAWGERHKPLGPPGFPGMCFNVAKLDGGVAFNVVPDAASLSVSLRPPPGADSASVRAELITLAHETVRGAQLETHLDNPPFETRDLEAFRPWLTPAGAAPLEAVDLAFWTEAAVLSAAGVDAVVIGPGDIAQAHGPDEWVERSQLEAAHALFVHLFSHSATKV